MYYFSALATIEETKMMRLVLSQKLLFRIKKNYYFQLVPLRLYGKNWLNYRNLVSQRTTKCILIHRKTMQVYCCGNRSKCEKEITLFISVAFTCWLLIACFRFTTTAVPEIACIALSAFVTNTFTTPHIELKYAIEYSNRWLFFQSIRSDPNITYTQRYWVNAHEGSSTHPNCVRRCTDVKEVWLRLLRTNTLTSNRSLLAPSGYGSTCIFICFHSFTVRCLDYTNRTQLTSTFQIRTKHLSSYNCLKGKWFKWLFDLISYLQILV